MDVMKKSFGVERESLPEEELCEYVITRQRAGYRWKPSFL